MTETDDKILMQLGTAHHALAAARSIGDFKKIADVAALAERYAKRVKLSQETADFALEIRLRAERGGIECVGLIKSCPGGEFAIGTKAAALMGGLGRTINGSYAEFTRAPVSNVAAIESDLSWADLASIPETYATAWTCLFRNLEIAGGQTLVIRGATSSFGQAAVNMAVNTGAQVIATTRNRERFGLLEGLGVERVEVEGPESP